MSVISNTTLSTATVVFTDITSSRVSTSLPTVWGSASTSARTHNSSLDVGTTYSSTLVEPNATTVKSEGSESCVKYLSTMHYKYIGCDANMTWIEFCKEPDEFEIGKSIGLTVLCLLAIIANATTIAATFYIKPPRKAHHYLFRNLFLVDILASLALLVNACRSLTATLEFQILPVQNTKLNYTITFAPLCAAFSCAVFALLALAIQRYIAVCYPLHHSSLCTKRNAVIYITCSWVVAIILGLLVLLWAACILPVHDLLLPAIPAIGIVITIIIIGLCFWVYVKTREAIKRFELLKIKSTNKESSSKKKKVPTATLR